MRHLLGLDAAGGGGWNTAAALCADCGARKPAIVIADADFLIAATAPFHELTFVATDARLAENLKQIGFAAPVDLVPLE